MCDITRNRLILSSTITIIVLTVLAAIFLPHFLRTTGKITGKQHVVAWDEYHPAWDEYHSGYTSSHTTRDADGKRHTYTTYHPSYTEHHAAWTEHHPDQWKLFVGESTVYVNATMFESAEIGDWLGADGFYGHTVIKKGNIE